METALVSGKESLTDNKISTLPLTHCRMLLHAFFAAANSIFLNLTWNLTSPQAHSDVHFVKPFLRLLGTLAGDQRICSRSEEFRRMNRICNELNNEAKKAIELFGISMIESIET